jgi:lipid-A-disaccharide synthase
MSAVNAPPGTPIPGLLFTAFEPSGDQIAAPVIALLRELRPALPVHATGASRMKAAGATILETTGHDAAMLTGAVAHAMAHKRRLARLRAWLCEHEVAALIPVDSPAANWSICKLVREVHPSAKILHLVAPQVWAWGTWRINKLRRLTDQLLCMLPFEPDWFANRDVPGVFIGHPLYSNLLDTHAPPAADLPDGGPRLALLPGSRASEHHNNWGMMFRVFESLLTTHRGLTGVVAAVDDAAAARLAGIVPKGMVIPPDMARPREGGGGEPRWWPASMQMRVGRVDDVLRWCDAALVVSGTATLHTAVYEKPMVVVYNARRLTWRMAGQFIIHTRTFALPNLIAESEGRPRIVPEFVPHFGAIEPVVAALVPLLSSPAARREQVESLRWMGGLFRGINFARRAAEQVLKFVGK